MTPRTDKLKQPKIMVFTNLQAVLMESEQQYQRFQTSKLHALPDMSKESMGLD